MKNALKALFISFFAIFYCTLGSQELGITLPTPPVMEEPSMTTIDEAATEAEVVADISPDAIKRANQEVVEAEKSETTQNPEMPAQPETSQSPETAIPETPQSQEEPSMQPDVMGATVDIGLSSEVRQRVATLLNKLLADEYVLYTKTLKFHWNVKGIMFHDFHKAFKQQYEKLFEIVDATAERVRALGAPALGSLQEFVTYTRLKEMANQKLSALDMVKQLLADHETIIKMIRTNLQEIAQLEDQGTHNFLQKLIEKHEKIAWMLRATAAQ